MNKDQFNEKYAKYLTPRFYGCALHCEPAIDFLDNVFGDLTKIPEFEYQQIKMKFNYCCFYCSGISENLRQSIEQAINKIIDHNV